VTTEAKRIDILPISVDDAEAVAQLSGELGYPTDAACMAQRIADVISAAGQTAFVAHMVPEVVGWIEVSISFHLQSEPHALIGGLVVRSDVRSLGIGAALCDRAEEWARDQEMKIIRVRSQIARLNAHKFYERQGYRQTKSSAVFEKALGTQ
jgi:predicted N-acetyltransferase YhbS